MFKISCLVIAFVISTNAHATAATERCTSDRDCPRKKQCLLKDNVGKCVKGCDDGSYCELEELCYDDFALGKVCVPKEYTYPCNGVICEEGTICKVKNHMAYCGCPSGFRFDARNTERGSKGECKKKCNVTSDCEPNQLCNRQPNPRLKLCVEREEVTSCDSVICGEGKYCSNEPLEMKCVCNDDLITILSDDKSRETCHARCASTMLCPLVEICSYISDHGGACVDPLFGLCNMVICHGNLECISDEYNNKRCGCRQDEVKYVYAGSPSCHKSCQINSDCDSNRCFGSEFCLDPVSR